MNRMDESIKKQLEDIDRKRSEIRKKLELEVQPLARAAKALFRKLGKKKGFIRKVTEFRAGDLIISGRGYFHDKVTVHYKGDLVFQFDAGLCYLNIDGAGRKLLMVYKSGEWEDLVVQEYRKMTMGDLEEKFDLSVDE